jgi:hypothetical protein
MRRPGRDDRSLAELDQLVKEITVEASSDDERHRAFRQAFKDNIAVPCDGFVIGEPVSVIGFDYEGNERRGLTARCRREDGSEYVVAAADVVLPQRSGGARHVAAYRGWLGLDPFPPETTVPALGRRKHKVTAADLDLTGPLELVALSVKRNAAHCRLLGSDRVVTLRASRLREVIPGEIVVVKPRKQWSYAGHPYLSGEIESTRLDVPVLGLVPLRLADRGIWDPEEEYWGEEGEPIEEWARPIIARGPRPEYEMEQILPGEDKDDPSDDPITKSIDLKDAGDFVGADKILMEICKADLRCLDAHAHLGNFAFDRIPGEAIRHYEVGLRIGELSLGDGFEGVLPWGLIDNRPFLRCMQGYGLCLWRLGRFEEAERVFGKMLWMNPSDNQGVRSLIGDVRARKAWEEDER